VVNNSNAGKKGFLKGIAYGILPHSFCIAFIVFSAIGAVGATALVKDILLIPYFFEFLIILSFIFATFSAVIYLKSKKCLCISGIKNRWKYLTILYSATILINLLMFFVVFPAMANINYDKALANGRDYKNLSLSVQIPCSGHSFLVINELKKIDGVNNVKFKLPNIFEVTYDPQKVSYQQIVSPEIFKTYKATVQ
jgi:hypothetical protein